MNIFVSNISFKVREAALIELFSQFGEVSSARIIKDKETRRSRGFGFVEMPNDAEGQKAIDSLNGTEYFERSILVSLAKGKPENSEKQTA
ncbi:MAG: RNA recognition motif domain-containing protein [Bacteroidota bacterium]|jgi:RNA recognition motif-containing protein